MKLELSSPTCCDGKRGPPHCIINLSAIPMNPLQSLGPSCFALWYHFVIGITVPLQVPCYAKSRTVAHGSHNDSHGQKGQLGTQHCVPVPSGKRPTSSTKKRSHTACCETHPKLPSPFYGEGVYGRCGKNRKYGTGMHRGAPVR